MLLYTTIGDDVIEIADKDYSTLSASNDDTTTSPSCEATPGDSYGETSSMSPKMIHCEDGGYMGDPRTISNSPIRIQTFKRINDLEGARYWHQTSGRGQRKRNAGFRGQQISLKGGDRWLERDSFDELVGEDFVVVVVVDVNVVVLSGTSTANGSGWKKPQSKKWQGKKPNWKGRYWKGGKYLKK